MMMVPSPRPPARPVGNPAAPPPRRSSILSLRGNSSMRISPRPVLTGVRGSSWADTNAEQVAKFDADHFFSESGSLAPEAVVPPEMLEGGAVK
jgi:hypothetical protein